MSVSLVKNPFSVYFSTFSFTRSDVQSFLSTCPAVPATDQHALLHSAAVDTHRTLVKADLRSFIRSTTRTPARTR